MHSGSEVTIVATSIMVVEAVRVAKQLAGQNISVEVIDLVSPSHPNMKLIIESVRKTGRLIIADTSWLPYGVSAEVCRLIAQSDPSILIEPVKCIGMAPAPCPTAKSLEDIFYPSTRELSASVYEILKKDITAQTDLTSIGSMSDYYKTFKGPF